MSEMSDFKDNRTAAQKRPKTVHTPCCTASTDDVRVHLVLDHPHLPDREERWFARAVGGFALRPRHVRRPRYALPRGRWGLTISRVMGEGECVDVIRQVTVSSPEFVHLSYCCSRMRRMLGCSPATGCVRSLTASYRLMTLLTIVILAGDGVPVNPSGEFFVRMIAMVLCLFDLLFSRREGRPSGTSPETGGPS